MGLVNLLFVVLFQDGSFLVIVVGLLFEIGLISLMVDLSEFGEVIQIVGVIGIGIILNDFLLDLVGDIMLIGGDGVDVFVMVWDVDQDLIIDFDIDEDWLDLFVWVMLRYKS